ncbi:c-type cytochrome [Pararhodonellum marinum]|uniref:c-type cytochrome n=1 Tax=Pararhodonellum marinum TaxID=2755358 RepID=UPI001E384BE3|nr:c-type cytochrome [Pararhodonellum marinum]
MKTSKTYFNTFLSFSCFALVAFSALGQESPMEEDYFKIMKVSSPEGTLLEVGGLAFSDQGTLGVATRRGDVFMVENPSSPRPYFRKFATGLHEILGLTYKDGSWYCAQRGELTKLTDTTQDGLADTYETIFSWPISGHYHEYSFGPVMDQEGNFYVSGNVAFGNEEWWRGESRVPYRGWVMKISPDGKMEPFATGMRSPAGLGMIDGKLFYTENQGDYIGSGGLWHLEKGDFTGHPAGLAWTGVEGSPLQLTAAQFDVVVDPRKVKNENGRYIKPENIIDEEFVTMYQAKEKIKELKLPAVWLPHGIHGISNAEPLQIPKGHLGPFEGQILVGDQGQSKIMRIMLEEVNGEYQGASIDFRSGFQSGVLRMVFGPDQSLFVGETNRGWGSAGEANEGLQRMVWNNELPFEMRNIKSMPDGFEIEFTKPVDPKSAEDLASYAVQSFTYKYTPVYGSPPVNILDNPITGVKLSEDGKKVRILVENLRRYYIHKLSLDGLREKLEFHSLVHPTAYYTLNNIPEGNKLTLAEVSQFNSAEERKKQEEEAAKKAAATKKPLTASSTAVVKPEAPKGDEVPSLEVVNALLAKNTCTACHAADKKQVGPSYTDIAKRRYTNEQIVELIYYPKPENWPDYATPMPPMPQVPKEEALKIAAYINSLR